MPDHTITITVTLDDTELQARAAAPRTASYRPEEMADFKFYAACVAAVREQHDADQAGEDAPLAPAPASGRGGVTTVDGAAGFAASSRRADDTGPGGGEE